MLVSMHGSLYSLSNAGYNFETLILRNGTLPDF